MTPCHTSSPEHQPVARFFKRALLSSFSIFAITAYSTNSIAEVEIIDVSGASRTEGINTADDEDTPTIFGGRGGDDIDCDTSNSTTGGFCNSCSKKTTAINAIPRGTGGTCNNQMIRSSTNITISFTSAKTGYPTLTRSDKTTLVKKSSSSITAGQTASIETTWGAVCNGATGLDANCDPSGGSAVTASLLIGISKDNDGTLDDADDEYETVPFIVSDVMDENDMNIAGDSCTSGASPLSTQNSVCEYAIQSGDEKAILTNIGKFGDFPTLSGINVYALRVYFQQCNFTGTIDASQFNSIAPSSINYIDLPVTSDDNGIPELLESEITNLRNGATYCTKLAHVDQAGNVGLFTSAGGDVNCANVVTHLKNPTGQAYANTCHLARPDEVLGVMAESCFIATAAYGSPWAIKVQTFRDFRNKYLAPSAFGRTLVKFYYKHSPKFAAAIAKNDHARLAARIALSPLWLFAAISLKIGAIPTALLFVSAIGGLVIFFKRRRQMKAST